MPIYTVEYKMIYDMTVEVEAEDESEALDKAYDEALNDNGTEHDLEYEGFNVIRVEEDEEELSKEEIAAQKGDMQYRARRDEQ